MNCGIPTRTDVFEFLQSRAHPLGVLAYLDPDGHPDSACVAFSATPNLEIIFGTSDQSRKFPCLTADSHVGFNVTDPIYRLTVQLKGTVREIGGPTLEDHERMHYAKLAEDSRRFRDLPDQHFFRISPIVTQYSDCLQEPWQVFNF